MCVYETFVNVKIENKLIWIISVWEFLHTCRWVTYICIQQTAVDASLKSRQLLLSGCVRSIVWSVASVPIIDISAPAFPAWCADLADLWQETRGVSQNPRQGSHIRHPEGLYGETVRESANHILESESISLEVLWILCRKSHADMFFTWISERILFLSFECKMNVLTLLILETW